MLRCKKFPLRLESDRGCRPMPILFLDFDGVLHPEHCHESKHFSCLPVFERALHQVPDCKVVIASTWRLQTPGKRLREKLGSDVASKVVGVTPQYCDLHDVPPTLVGYEREAECHAWLLANKVRHEPWLAVDDRSWLYRPFCKSLFLTNGRTGLCTVSGELLVARLMKLL